MAFWFANMNQLHRRESGGWRRTDGGRGALRINALFHFKVREIRCWRHIVTPTETDVKRPFTRGQISGEDHGSEVTRETARSSSPHTLDSVSRLGVSGESWIFKDALRSQEG